MDKKVLIKVIFTKPKGHLLKRLVLAQIKAINPLNNERKKSC